MNWITYVRLGRLVWSILERQFSERMPALRTVPIEDLLAVVEEVLTTTATIEEARLRGEPAPPRLLSGAAVDPGRQVYRLSLPSTRQRGES